MTSSSTTPASLAMDLEAYQQAHPPPRRWGFAWRIALAAELALLIAVLQYAVGTLHVINSDFFPTPFAVAASLVTLFTGQQFLADVAFSLSNYAIGVLLASTVGIVFGLAIGLSSLLDLTLKPFVWTFYAIPKVALAPLMILALGLGPASKIAMVFLLGVFPVLLSTLDGVRTVDATLLRAAGVFGFRGVRLARSVILPATMPFVLVGLRRAIALGFIGEILGEFLGSEHGLGVRLQRASSALQMDDAIAVVVVMVVAANIGLLVLDRIQRVAAPWSLDEAGRGRSS